MGFSLEIDGTVYLMQSQRSLRIIQLIHVDQAASSILRWRAILSIS